MLFRRDIEPSCGYCQYAAGEPEEPERCEKHGIIPEEFHCRNFRYDPLKRIPPRPAVLRRRNFKPEDFTL